MVAPGTDRGGDLLSDPLGKGDRKSSLGKAGGVQGKGNRFPIPLRILNGGALTSLAKPSTPDLGRPEAAQWIEGHFDWSAFQAP